jgi:hypothetical protein
LRPAWVAVILACTVLGAAGCGGGSNARTHTRTRTSSPSKAKPDSAAALKAADTKVVCTKGVPVLTGRLHVAPHSVQTSLTHTSDAMPQCNFHLTGGGAPLSLWVSLDSSPQPYQVLERRSTEEGQNFAMMPHFKYPQAYAHLGLDGWWFPREQQAQTTDGRVLITVTIMSWPDHGNAPRKALSAAVARAYLGPLRRGARLVAS